jgi:hypothetical protein
MPIDVSVDNIVYYFTLHAILVRIHQTMRIVLQLAECTRSILRICLIICLEYIIIYTYIQACVLICQINLVMPSAHARG